MCQRHICLWHDSPLTIKIFTTVFSKVFITIFSQVAFLPQTSPFYRKMYGNFGDFQYILHSTVGLAPAENWFIARKEVLPSNAIPLEYGRFANSFWRSIFIPQGQAAAEMKKMNCYYSDYKFCDHSTDCLLMSTIWQSKIKLCALFL